MLKVPHSTFPGSGTGILLLLSPSVITVYYSFDYTLKVLNSLSDQIVDRQQSQDDYYLPLLVP